MLSTLFFTSALATLAVGQSASTTVSQSMPPTATAGFNPANVSSSDAFLWCHAQLNTCPEICGGDAPTNTCQQDTFTYSCICGNGTQPDCTAYQQTLAFYICEATYQQCVNNHPDDAQGQATCKSNEKCGTLNATLASSSSGSGSSSSVPASGSATSTSTAPSSKATSASASAASASSSSVANTQQLATGALAAVLMAACKLFL